MTEAVKHQMLLSVALSESDAAQVNELYQTLMQKDAEIERLRAALKPFAEVPPGGRGVSARMMVTFAGDGPFHFFEGDLVRAKEVYRGLEQSPRQGEQT